MGFDIEKGTSVLRLKAAIEWNLFSAQRAEVLNFGHKIRALAEQPIIALQLSSVPDRGPLARQISDQGSNERRINGAACGELT